MPMFVHALVAWSRRRPALALLGSGLVGWLLYWHLAPAPPAVRPVVAKAQTVPANQLISRAPNQQLGVMPTRR